MQKKIINNEKGILDKYYEFLKLESNKLPKDIYKLLDIYIEKEEVYLKGIEYFDKQLDNYRKIMEGGN